MQKTKSKDVIGKQQLRIEYMPLSALRRARENPKRHEVEKLHDSMSRFGFVAPIILDEKSGELVAGHGRLETLEHDKDAGKNPPARVLKKKDDWFVPVIRGIAFNNPGEAEAYLLADNQLTIAGGWDDQELLDALNALIEQAEEPTAGLLGTGFEMDSIRELESSLAAIPVEEGETNPAEEWKGMPTFNQEDKTAFQSITIHLKDQEAVDAFAKAIGKVITKHTKYLHYPESEIQKILTQASE